MQLQTNFKSRLFEASSPQRKNGVGSGLVGFIITSITVLAILPPYHQEAPHYSEHF